MVMMRTRVLKDMFWNIVSNILTDGPPGVTCYQEYSARSLRSYHEVDEVPYLNPNIYTLLRKHMVIELYICAAASMLHLSCMYPALRVLRQGSPHRVIRIDIGIDWLHNISHVTSTKLSAPDSLQS